MTDKEFDHLCEANSFGAVARNEFPLVPRAMLKALVDAAVSTEILKQQDHIKRLEEAGDKMASAWQKEWLTDADIEAIIDYWYGAKEDKP